MGSLLQNVQHILFNVMTISGKECGEPPEVTNSTIVVTEGTLFGDRISYSCDVGYESLGGNLTRICTEDGIWSGRMPVCSSEFCF